MQDDLGRDITIPTGGAQRIVSLVPSITETLFAIGAGDRVVGVTKFCIKPTAAHDKTKVGGTKQVDYDLIKSLQPDLIIANKEENTPEIVAALAENHAVFITDTNNFNDALAMIGNMGMLTDCTERANEIVNTIVKEYHFYQQQSKIFRQQKLSVAYFIWRKPYMIAAADTYIDSILQIMGLCNAAAYLSRYPNVSMAEIANLQADLIFLSSEPYPFQAKHIAELQTVLPKAKIILVEGEAFSWHGAGLVDAFPYFLRLIAKINN